MKVKLIPEDLIFEVSPVLMGGLGEVLVYRSDLEPKKREWESRKPGTYEIIEE
jgi:hypothetical protein